MSRTLSALFIVGAVDEQAEKEGKDKSGKLQDNPGQIRKIPEKSGMSQKGQKGRTERKDKKEGRKRKDKKEGQKGRTKRKDKKEGRKRTKRKDEKGQKGRTSTDRETSPFEPPPRLPALVLARSELFSLKNRFVLQLSITLKNRENFQLF